MSGIYDDHWDEMMKSSKYHPRRNQQIYKWKLGIIIEPVMLDHMQKEKNQSDKSIKEKNSSQRKLHLWNLEGPILFCEKSQYCLLQYCLQLWIPHIEKNRPAVQDKISNMTERKCALKEILAIRFKYGKQTEEEAQNKIQKM